MVDNQEAGDYSGIISRRRFVQVAGVSGAAALAGCGGGETTEAPADTTDGDGDPGDDTTTESDEGQVYDVAFENLNDGENTDELHWNYINSSNYAAWPMESNTDRGLAFNYQEGEYVPLAFEDWDISGDTVEISIREDLAWADGTDYTSQHAKEEIALSNIAGSSIWDYIETLDDIETPDDKTLVLNLTEESNPEIIEHAIGGFRTNIRAKEDTPYKEVYDAMVENGVDDLDDETVQKVSDYSPEEPDMTCGPWVHSDQSANRIRLERNPEHPDAENINFKYYDWGSSPGNEHKQSQLVSGKVNAVMSLFVPARIVANLPDNIEEARPPAKWGIGLMPNHEEPHVEHREVRQAIQYAIDRDTVVKNAGPRTKQTPKTPGGIAASEEETWLGDEIDSYMTYEETEKGEEVLEEADYSKDNGTWKDSNGKTARLELTVMAGWSDWVTAAQTMIDELNDFGFDAELNSVPQGTVNGDIVPNSKFHIQLWWWLPGSAQSSFPYYPLRHQYGYVWNKENVHKYPAWNGGDGTEITVPAMDGGDLTINPLKRVEELATMTDETEVTETIRELHWVNNVDQPMMPITEKLEQSWYQNDSDMAEQEWVAADGDSSVAGIKWPTCYLPRVGELEYVGEE
ncbi:MAG: ABC transporter substrate-binding protein [archaeon]